jgi:hypothetical protein
MQKYENIFECMFKSMCENSVYGIIFVANLV